MKIGEDWGVLDAENPGLWALYGDDRYGDARDAREGAGCLNNGDDLNNYEWTPKPVDADTDSV